MWSTYQQLEDVDVDDFLNLWEQKMTLAEQSLTRYKEKTVATANKKCQPMEFFEGD